jgi:hypothetical protein
MGNWTSCKVKIKQVDSEINIDLLTDKINHLKEQNNISNTNNSNIKHQHEKLFPFPTHCR